MQGRISCLVIETNKSKMKQYTEKLIGIGALMLLIAVTITIIISYSQAERIKQTTGQLAGVNERLHLLEDLLLHTLDNTTIERGYALTGQEPYVAAIRQNTRAIQQNMKELQIVFSHGQLPPVLIDSLLFYLQARIQYIERLIQVTRREGPAAVSDLIRKGEEESFLPQIRRLIVLLENKAREEQKLLNARKQNNLLILNRLLLGSLIVIFLLMAVILFVVKKELDRRKKMQAELNRFNERLTEEVKQKTREQTEILERISDAFAVLDKNWNYIYLNKQAAAYIGKDPEELIGKNIWQENPEWMGMPFQKACFRAMEEQKIIYHEEYNAEWDKWFELHIYPSPKGLSIFFRDITDRKKADQIIKESEEKMKLIFNSVHDILFLISVQENRYCFDSVNHSFLRSTGFTREQVEGKYVDEIIPEPSLSLVLKNYQQAIAQKKTVQWEEATHYPTGTKTGIVSITPTFDKNGVCKILVGGVHDITDRKKAEEEIKNTNEQLRQLTAYLQTVREEERRHISREIHDELGQQLTAVKMDLAWLDKKITDKETLLKAKLKNSISLLDDCNVSIRKILSELRMGLQERQSLPEALEWLLQQFKAQSGVVVSFNSDVQIKNIEEPVAACIFRVCQEALTNITRYAEAKKVKASLIQKDNQLLFEIEDDGKGFDSDTVNKKGSFGILGMKERVNALNGNFKLVSAKGMGTKIVVSLPYKT